MNDHSSGTRIQDVPEDTFLGGDGWVRFLLAEQRKSQIQVFIKGIGEGHRREVEAD